MKAVAFFIPLHPLSHEDESRHVKIMVFLVNMRTIFGHSVILRLFCIPKHQDAIMKAILTITGSDSTGGSGLQADIRTISALGGQAVSAVTSITLQNTLGIQAFYDLPPEIVRGQIEAVVNDIQPEIVKIGMIRTVGTLAAIVATLTKYSPKFVIYDPIVMSAGGERLMSDDVLVQVIHELIPRCSLVILRDIDAHKAFSNAVGADKALIVKDLTRHGYSSSFSSALSVFLAETDNLQEAVARAKEYIRTLITRDSNLQGRSSQLYDEFAELVRSHCNTNRDVAFYADCMNVTPRYLAQVTHRISGLSPKSIIDRQLAETLQRQLLTTRSSVQEIAYSYGFTSQAQFSKFFKKETGLSPTEFRKKSDNETLTHNII